MPQVRKASEGPISIAAVPATTFIGAAKGGRAACSVSGQGPTGATDCAGTGGRKEEIFSISRRSESMRLLSCF